MADLRGRHGRRRAFVRALAARALALAAGAVVGAAPAQGRFIVMASTTSTEQSGLFNHLLPLFKAATGIEVRVVAVGTGQALDMARRGDADVLFVHDTAAELKFVAEGFAPGRRDVMTNDFVLIGPAADPAGVKGRSILLALQRLASTAAAFISRGDKSGTHMAELRLWAEAAVKLAPARPAGYRECGCGMGPALNMASSLGAYTLADRATWLAFKNRGDLVVLVEGDRRLFNQYGVLVVSGQRFAHLKTEMAQAFADWIVSPAGQNALATFRIDGQQLFFPNASRATN